MALTLSAPLLCLADCKVSAVEMPVTMVGTRAVATLGLNGTEVRMTVDTGADYSMLTEAVATELRLPPTYMLPGLRVQGVTGPVDAHLTVVKRMQLLRGELPNVEFIVGGNEPGSGTKGLLGRNILSITDMEFDLSHGAIRFMFPTADCDGKNMAYWADNIPVSEVGLRWDFAQRLPPMKATVKLNGVELRALFDTGASSIVSLAAAKRAGLTEADLRPAGTIRGAGSGEARAWIANVKTFQIAGETSENNRLRVGEFSAKDYDMLLGIDFFLSHRVYVSKSQHRMYFTYNGGPVFALNAAAETPDNTTNTETPEDADGFARRGAAAAARHEYVRALEDFDRACEMAPGVADYFVQRGMVQEALKVRPAARRDFDTALALDPRHANALWERASLRAAERDRDGALGDLQILDGVLSPQAQRRFDMSQLYGRLQVPDKVVAQLDLWIPVHLSETGLDAALDARCWARAELGVELDKALTDCDRALELRPKTPLYLNNRAWVRLRRGDLPEALADFDRALQEKPDFAMSLYGRGLARLQMGDAERGHADIEAARKWVPTVDALVRRFGFGVPAAATKP